MKRLAETRENLPGSDRSKGCSTGQCRQAAPNGASYFFFGFQQKANDRSQLYGFPKGQIYFLWLLEETPDVWRLEVWLEKITMWNIFNLPRMWSPMMLHYIEQIFNSWFHNEPYDAMRLSQTGVNLFASLQAAAAAFDVKYIIVKYCLRLGLNLLYQCTRSCTANHPSKGKSISAKPFAWFQQLRSWIRIHRLFITINKAYDEMV